MMIYSVSCTVNTEIAEAWQRFFLEKHLADVVNTGCFTKYSFRKKESDDTATTTFVSEYYYEKAEDLERYNQHYAPALKAEVGEKFAGQFECQRTLFQVIC